MVAATYAKVERQQPGVIAMAASISRVHHRSMSAVGLNSDQTPRIPLRELLENNVQIVGFDPPNPDRKRFHHGMFFERRSLTEFLSQT